MKPMPSWIVRRSSLRLFNYRPLVAFKALAGLVPGLTPALIGHHRVAWLMTKLPAMAGTAAPSRYRYRYRYKPQNTVTA